MACFEEDLIAWARKLGYAPNDASLSKQSIAKLLRTPGSRTMLEFAVKARAQ